MREWVRARVCACVCVRVLVFIVDFCEQLSSFINYIHVDKHWPKIVNSHRVVKCI